jgi:uncharacterized iron-regulated membrane protein
MTPRRFLFWVHLAAGTLAGLVIFVMSVTGVLLAYKRQILNRADRGFQSQPPPGAQRLPVDELLAKLQMAQNKMPSGVTVRSAPAAPVSFDFGRERTVFVDPYTGQALGEESPRLRAFFSKIEDVHRWLGMSSENRAAGRAMTGACNLSSLILVVSGPILWWPKEWTGRNLKRITLLHGGPWRRARDWNWHNALGFWCAVPLFLIVVTGVIMSYGWANNLLYRATGNPPPPPPQNQAAAQSPPEQQPHQGKRRAAEAPHFDNFENLFARAAQQVPGWTAIGVRLPNTPQDTLTFAIDQGNGGRPDLRSQLTLDRRSGQVLRWEPFSSYNRGRQLRSWVRFTHTGEAFGLGGQTVAALASAGASLLVFTGLALALRRLAGLKSRRGTKPEFREPGTIEAESLKSLS